MVTVEQVQKALPANLKKAATPTLVQTINSVVADPEAAEAIRENFLSYTKVLQDGKFKIEDYLNAVMYVSYKLMNHTNADAYAKTFPQRYANLVAKGADDKEISAYVAMYNKGKLVNLILEQSLVPSWVLNQDVYQEAINTQFKLMTTSRSDLVRMQAANSILTHLQKPKEAGPLVNISMNESSGLNELTGMLRELAQKSQRAITSGDVTPKQVAEQKLVVEDAEVVE